MKENGEKLLLRDHLDAECGKERSSLKDQIGQVTSFKTVSGKKFRLCNLYEINIKPGTLQVIVCEENIYRQMYNNQKIYNALWLDMSITVDVALAKGGTEAIVESFYSTMKAQLTHGGQDSKTLALRLKLKWSLTPILQAERLVSKTAKVYISGKKERDLKSHKWPVA